MGEFNFFYNFKLHGFVNEVSIESVADNICTTPSKDRQNTPTRQCVAITRYNLGVLQLIQHTLLKYFASIIKYEIDNRR